MWNRTAMGGKTQKIRRKRGHFGARGVYKNDFVVVGGG